MSEPTYFDNMPLHLLRDALKPHLISLSQVPPDIFSLEPKVWSKEYTIIWRAIMNGHYAYFDYFTLNDFLRGREEITRLGIVPYMVDASSKRIEASIEDIRRSGLDPGLKEAFEKYDMNQHNLTVNKMIWSLYVDLQCAVNNGVCYGLAQNIHLYDEIPQKVLTTLLEILRSMNPRIQCALVKRQPSRTSHYQCVLVCTKGEGCKHPMLSSELSDYRPL